MNHNLKLAAIATLCLSGCLVATVNRDGFMVQQRDTDDQVAAVKNRASFEMSCPPEELKVTVLNTYFGGSTVNQLGVSGCGQKLVYVRAGAYGENWVLNGQSAKAD